MFLISGKKIFVRKKIKSFYVQKILSKYVNYIAILNAFYLSVDCAAVVTAMGGQGIRKDQELQAVFSYATSSRPA